MRSHCSRNAIQIQIQKTDKEKVNQKETTARINALGVEMDLWNEFLGIRKKLKANNSTRGVNTLLNRIEKLVRQGQDATGMIEEANAQGLENSLRRKGRKACTTNSKATPR